MEPLFQHQKDQAAQGAEKRGIRRSPKLFNRLSLQHKKLKSALYVSVVVIAGVWLAIGINTYWGNKTPQNLSQNTARLQAVASDVDQLPLPSTINYGETSSTLPVVVAKYQAEREAIKRLRPVQFTVLNSYPSTREKNAVSAKANATLNTIDSTLLYGSNALLLSAKLLQYDPETDLQPYASGVEADASERLVRTNQGIKDVVAALQASDVPYKDPLVSQAQKLIGQAPKVSRQGVPAWAAEVHAVQQAMLQTIQDNTATPLRADVAKLRVLAAQYQN